MPFALYAVQIAAYGLQVLAEKNSAMQCGGWISSSGILVVMWMELCCLSASLLANWIVKHA